MNTALEWVEVASAEGWYTRIGNDGGVAALTLVDGKPRTYGASYAVVEAGAISADQWREILREARAA